MLQEPIIEGCDLIREVEGGFSEEVMFELKGGRNCLSKEENPYREQYDKYEKS